MPLVTSVNRFYFGTQIHTILHRTTRLYHITASIVGHCRHLNARLNHPFAHGSLGSRWQGCLALDRVLRYSIGSGVRTDLLLYRSLHYTLYGGPNAVS